MPVLLIDQKSLSRLDAELNDLRQSHPFEMITVNAAGQLERDGAVIGENDADFDFFWFNIDIYLGGHLPRLIPMLLNSSSLKWIQSFNAGMDNPIYKQFHDRGIRIAKSSAQAIAIAEYVLCSVMAQHQEVIRRHQLQRDKNWQSLPFRELYREKWLIIGFGNIGKEIARRASAFECEITAVRRKVEYSSHVDRCISLDAMPDYLAEADVVVLACGLNSKTRNLADERFFQTMKPGSTLVNIARGALVNETALLDGLKQKKPEFAVLDVFSPEPLPPESPLWDCPNVSITAHASNFGNRTFRRGDELFLNNFRRFLAGKELINEVKDDDF